MNNQLNLYAKGNNILIVDDDAMVQKIIKNSLDKYFKNIVVASDGKIALDIYKKAGKNFFSVVVTDISMPNMDGIELSKEIKNINSYQSIIVLSAVEDLNSLIEIIEIGVDTFVPKPIDIDKLTAKLINSLENQFFIAQIKDLERERIISEYKAENKIETKKDKKLEIKKHEKILQAIELKKKKLEEVSEDKTSAKEYIDTIEDKKLLKYEINNLVFYIDDLEDSINSIFEYVDSESIHNISKVLDCIYNSIANIDMNNRLKNLTDTLYENSQFFQELSYKDVNPNKQEELEVLEFLLDDLKNFLMDVLIKQTSLDIDLYANCIHSNFEQLRFRLDDNSKKEDVMFF